MPNEETTTKLNVDISELKKSMQDAKRAVSVANSEFKASVSTLEDWSNTTEGVSAKIKQLNSNVQSHEKILDSLEQQYKAVVAEQGENSKAAQNLEIKINNQKATVNKTAMELKKYENQLQTLESEQQKAAQETEKQISTYDKLKNTISEQENELASLKKEYASTALEQGKNSDSARELANKIESLSTELNANKTIMKNADKAADDLDESLDDTADSAKDASEGFTVMKGAISSLIADGLKALAQAAKESMQELVFETENAYDKFQGKTGTATAEMGKFQDKIEDLYSNNYGESISDIADAMAEVKQQTKEVDPSKLQELTKYALNLRDTFDMDVPESIRAAKMLMTQFGVSGEEAYNLIVQGAQKGLNKNGDLLDVINEYGVHYKQLGYSSDDFFNSLINGAETGTFSVDKLGDAVKEFGIRTKDTAKSTDEGFELIGLNANKMRNEFAKGGESAQEATKKTLKALFEMKDEVKQNQAGVALFGTMWEDLGKEGVKALMNTEGELTKTKASMKELDNLKMDNVATKFSMIGRKIQMDVILPLAEKALPTVEKFANKFIVDGDKIISKLKTIGTIIATVFVVNKLATFTQSIITMVSAWQKMKTAIAAAEGAQKLFNITQGATPWGAVALAIGAVVSGLVVYTSSTKDAESETEKFCKKIKASSEEMREQAKAYKEAEEARQNTLKGISSEYGYYEQLVDELSSITNENGKVVEGYENRAQVITGLLSNALGTEISTDKLVADGKQKVIDKIKELIEVQKAEAMLEAYKSDHLTALKEKEQAYTTYIEKKKEAAEASKKLAAAEKELTDYQEAFAEMTYVTEEDLAAYSVQVGNLTENVDKCKTAQEKANQAVDDAHYKYLGYQNTIATYDGVSAAIIEGDSAKINEALVLMSNNFKTAENSTREMLEGQVTAAKENLALLEQALKDGEPGISQQMVDNARLMVDKSVAELDKLAPNSKPPAEKHLQYFSRGITEKLNSVKQSGTAVANEVVKGEGTKNTESQNAGKNKVDFFNRGILGQTPKTKQAGTTIAKESVKGESSQTGESKTAGTKQSEEFVKGVKSKSGASNQAGKEVAKKGKDGMKSVDANSTGSDFSQGFINGIKSKLSAVWDAAVSVGKQALAAVKNAIDSNSPAKETIAEGENFGDGFVVGIKNRVKQSKDAAKELGVESVESLEKAAEDFNGFDARHEELQRQKDFGLISEQEYYDKLTELRDSYLRKYTDEWYDVTKKIYDYRKKVEEEAQNEAAESNEKARDKQFDNLKRALDRGLITEKEYYAELAKLRDKYYESGSDDWYRIDDEIYAYKRKVAEETQNEITESNEKARDKEFDDLKRSLDRGLITEKEYYAELAKLRDKYYESGSDDWYRIDDEIFAYNRRVIEDEGSKIKTLYDETTDYLKGRVEEVADLQKNIAQSLFDDGAYGKTFNTVKIISGDTEETFTKLADVGEDNKALEKYNSMLDELAKRRGGELPEEIAGYLSKMGIEEGTAYLEALLNSSDKDFEKYITSLEEKERLAGEISKKLTSKQADDLAKEIENGAEKLFTEFMEKSEKIPEVLAQLGWDSAEDFGEEFVKKINAVIDDVNNLFARKMSNIITGLDVNLSNANLNLSGVNANLNSGGFGGGIVNNYTQVINSPSSVNRLELYRHSKNLLGLQGGVK